ncbi:cysteine-rich DPF motif domain-containing protein 1 isoform 2-T2 [Pholidichthys leucotaenia]
MELTTARESRKDVFTCQLCHLSSPYTYYGQKPPNTRAIVLLEECFVSKDPFSPDKEKFLILGSICSLCNVRVCVGSVSRWLALASSWLLPGGQRPGARSVKRGWDGRG